jgi:hypothetical protein
MPPHCETGLGNKGAAGGRSTTTVTGIEEEEHPFGAVTVTKYEPERETLMEGVVSPVFQIIFVATSEVRVTDDPVQILVEPEDVTTGAVGAGRIITSTILEVPMQPLLPVITVK